MMISNTVNPKGMSPSPMRHLTVLLVLFFKFTHVKIKGPNKSIQLQNFKNRSCNMRFHLFVLLFLIAPGLKLS